MKKTYIKPEFEKSLYVIQDELANDAVSRPDNNLKPGDNTDTGWGDII